MKFVPLKEVVTFKGGGTPSKKEADYWDGDIPWATVKDFKGLEIFSTQNFISSKGLKKSAANMIPQGHVIIPTRMALGKAAINKVDLAINQDLKALIPKQKIIPEYLLYAILGLASQIEKRGAGATVKGITIENLNTLKIPLPSLDSQIRIATLLSRVKALIATRKENLRLFDEFLKSTFLEMFGDPVRNEKGWDKDTLGNILDDIQSGWSPKCEAKSADNDKWGILKLGAVTYCHYNESENKEFKEGMTPRDKIEVKTGDLLFSRKNTHQLVAACSYVFQTRPKLMMPDLIFRLVLKEDSGVDPIFLWKLLVNERQRSKIQSLAGGAAGSMPNISKAKLKTVEIPIPPQKVQNQFTIIVEKVEQLKKCSQQNLSELQNLYGALSQKAFKGELDLSNIPIDKIDPDKNAGGEGASVCTPIGSMGGKAEEKDIDLTDSSIRKAYVNSILKTYLSSQNDKHFSMDEFSSLIEEKLEQLSSEDNQTLMEAGYYDTIRNSLFHLLDNGQLVQNFNETSNKVELNIK